MQIVHPMPKTTGRNLHEIGGTFFPPHFYRSLEENVDYIYCLSFFNTQSNGFDAFNYRQAATGVFQKHTYEIISCKYHFLECPPQALQARLEAHRSGGWVMWRSPFCICGEISAMTCKPDKSRCRCSPNCRPLERPETLISVRLTLGP